MSEIFHRQEIAKIEDVKDTLILAFTKVMELKGSNDERLKAINHLIGQFTADQIALQDEFNERV